MLGNYSYNLSNQSILQLDSWFKGLKHLRFRPLSLENQYYVATYFTIMQFKTLAAKMTFTTQDYDGAKIFYVPFLIQDQIQMIKYDILKHTLSR